MRLLDAANEGALDDAYVHPVFFVELRFDNGTLRLHTDLGSITTTGTSPNRVWTGTGTLGQIGPIEETDGATPTRIEVTLSGIDSNVLDEARNQDYQDRPLLIFIGFRDIVTGAMKAEPDEIYYGFMDQMVINNSYQGSPASVTISVESEQSRWDRVPVRYFDDVTLQTAYAGDTFFVYLAALKNRQLRWGAVNDNPKIGVPSTR